MQVSCEQMETCLFITRVRCTSSRRSLCFADSESHRSISGIVFIVQSSTTFTWITSKCLWFPVLFQTAHQLPSCYYRWQQLLGALLWDMGRGGKACGKYMKFSCLETCFWFLQHRELHCGSQSEPSYRLIQIVLSTNISDGGNIFFTVSLTTCCWMFQDACGQGGLML